MSNVMPRIWMVSPGASPNSRAMSEPRTVTREPSSAAVSRRPWAAWTLNPSRPWSAPATAPMMSLGMPKPVAFTSSKNIWTCGSTAPDAVEAADLVGQGEVDGNDADAEAVARAVADDDLADVVVGAAGDEGVDLVGHGAEDDQRPDADDDAEDREGGPQLAAAQVAQDGHAAPVTARRGDRGQWSDGRRSEPSGLPDRAAASTMMGAEALKPLKVR